MSKLPIIVLIATIIIVVGGVFLLSKPETKIPDEPLPTTLQYFWSETCPHCKNVANFIDNWDKKDKLVLDKREISDTKNALLLTKRAEYCKLPTNSVGVPFLFTPDGKCITGDQPIIDYFKSLNL
jgi:glutaredoxin